MLKHFGLSLEGLELKIESRGAPPLGGGEVVLGVPIVQNSLSQTHVALAFEVPGGWHKEKHAAAVTVLQLLSDTEIVRWLNHAIEKVWPICMEQIASQQFLLPIVPWFLEKYKPWTAKKAVMQQLYLGRNPPVFTEIRVLRQSGDDDHLVLELGMNFLSADDMSAMLAVKLRKRLGFGMWAKMHITGMHVEGRVLVGVKFLRKWPFLGRLRVCFVEPPYFQMTVKPIFSHGLDVTELPGISGWLDKLLAIAFEETLVEPNMLVVNVEKFVSSPAEDWFTMDEKGAIAQAKVELIEGADMKPSDLNGLADPYVKGQLGSHRFQTKIQRKTLAPKWFEDFLIPITSWESANVLVLEVRDKDHIFDDMLGDCSVSIGPLRGGQRHDMWLPLKNIKMGRLHLAVTVLEGGPAVVAADQIEQDGGCGNDVQNDEDEQQKVSENTTTSAAAAAASDSSHVAPDSKIKTGDEYEPIDIDGQATTGIWVHRPGSDVPQKWEPRKGRNRRPDADLQSEDADCTDSRRSVASGSQQSDISSSEDNPKGSRVRPLGPIHKGIKKIGSLFHRSPRDKSPKSPGESPLPTPRVNIEAMNEENVSVKLVLDVNEAMVKDNTCPVKHSPGKEETESSGKGGQTKEMARSILNQVGKSAHQLKGVLSRKDSRKPKKEGEAPTNVDLSSSSSSTVEESLPPSGEHTTVIDGVPLDPASPSAIDENAEASSANEAIAEPDSSTAMLEEPTRPEADDDRGVDSPASARDLKPSHSARKVSFRLSDQAQDGEAAKCAPADHASEGSPRAGARPISP